MDFYATVLDFAGAEASHTHFGRSLRTTLADHDHNVRDFVCCEGGRLPAEMHCDEFHDSPGGVRESFVYWPKVKAQTDGEAHAKGFMLRDERYKYISRITGEDELYDMRADPREERNIIDDPALSLVVVDMQRKMLRWLQETADIVPFEHDLRFTRDMMLFKARKIVPPEKMDRLIQLLDAGVSFYPAIGRVMSEG